MMDLDLEECTSKTPIGVRCQLKVAALTPTQNAVGLDEVNDKVARYSAKTKADLKDYLIVHPVPIVIGNGGKFYLTDHHHLANALWKTAEGKNKAGIDTKNARVAVTVLHNFASLKGYHFWKAMHEARLVYLYDHNGGGPIRPKDLLPHVKDQRKDLIDMAMQWARSPEARGMPGYIGTY